LREPVAGKALAAARAVELVRPGMLLGLGSGSTAELFVKGVGRLVEGGMPITAVATSRATERLAASLGILLVKSLDRPIDLAVDGADEVGPELSVIKGGGGALTREKLVAAAARRYVIIADDSKLVDVLGKARPLPVEVLPFLWRPTAERVSAVADAGARWVIRGGSEDPFVTDNGGYVIDLSVPEGIPEPAALGARIKAVTGVVEHGLFVGMAHACILGGEGGTRVLGSLD
jgi:ribose 5-phosphate isomerase A